jgi:predicted Rossmann fold nucleotide-binding protein DprA/Smf involved in DNA uptake
VPVTCAADVLAAIGIEPPPAPEPAVLTLEPRLESIRAVVGDSATTANELARRTGQSAGAVAAALAELELLGLVEEAEGVYRTRGRR